ncbi:uncharacterized protein PHACADRAFT_258714 [Phanerochaete carnosa HHB-10118-sp]|uniref:Uncharacterized protein n=1 Tax=Phanerochaete carnosa (strain HHB-10118-sp) TaxID=650164 RepID=K5W6W3_PHACS|nr:uncharacterized protein PHACADRAFT_258714 [Phanerochaete carnosa HHB-10118-sp]EKM54699.1 hypothetical protein PHACADRAFT_258714 [Phanerochaete carnosa HHB-10118-sp]
MLITVYVKARPADDHDDALAFGPGGIQTEHLYLLEAKRYGKTLVPIFGYVPPTVAVRVTNRLA